MWLLDELRYLHKLFVTNVRQLLHLLSTSAHKARAHILKLLRKYYTLLFANAPAKVHKAMVDFNRWLLEVLADTRSEGIEWDPSYGEDPWQHGEPQLDEAFTFDTIQLLRTSREHYMMRCDCLRQTNADLTTELEQLKIQLKEALIRAFESQRNLQREKELAALREQRLVLGVQFGDYLAQQNSHPTKVNQQIASAFRKRDGLGSVPTEEVPADDPTPTSDLEEDGEVENTEIAASILADQQELVAKPSNEDEQESSEQQTPHSSDGIESISISGGCNYQQLIQLKANEEKNGSWYRHALRQLKEEHEQRRLLRKTSKKTTEARDVLTPPTLRRVDMETASLKIYKPLEFQELAATRDPVQDAGGSTWYRKALQLLKEERKSIRNRAESFSSTISIVD
ncbi:hypothetical protein PF005_g1292 [Phytophthora fragariae]|uniref:Uncharacterized protein n=2 Tax=Phytophthora TaxID=4783 RepID=A0A6A4EYG0_9STRA|nr:hypothetical protein PF003_g4199 [Phytophthora fragariae]KAE8949121.1 hypothetical protein PF009_g1314 [Phytophthora fragariae]KAE9030054.1 hypothetical protein PF011_g786 [Phytophthora fragariae]KAE9138178.1 hypothetical protein PF010_g1022 [Phytophthora fragariae]KAE9138972.1 hypothetical protein PF007_g1182 [Phytophthora fragariae]